MSTMDLRQAFAGLLTLSMFIMLGNMIKKDHIDSIIDDMKVDIQAAPVSMHASAAVTEQSLNTVSHLSKGPQKVNGEGLKPCWNAPPLKEAEQSKGFITFPLTNGPEYHISQIADAVVVARYLGATLVLPDIRSIKSGYSMGLGEIYDVQNVLNRLHGLVRVTRTLPAQVSNRNPPIVRVPNRVSEDYIVKKVQPIYKAKGIVKIETYFPSVNTTMAGNKKNLDSFACQAMFGTLQFQPEIQEVVESMVQKLQTWSQNLNGQFIAVDLRTEELGKECQRKDGTGRKLCYQPLEIGQFLKKIGYNQETVIYVTQTKWNHDLEALRNIFPKTYTKESVMPAAKNGKHLSPESTEFEKIIDFYICSKSDVFVAPNPGLFYANVAGMRIASGKNKILVPGEITSPSASASDYMSPYVYQKSHFAYACFC
ncbi:protein MANNAN SYNTHESIS-RELATED-like [Gastrolobium bilobum]|uniref:protein MANNAN SYNTHESIS-RELATED-like n=1 Tax=Gastrolobium bilobum TaxID=150636 RepID=UPI002AB26688|nr:protein MANNAN SYNTHESIS-RELATED-like [Gastrolobium bilobum]